MKETPSAQRQPNCLAKQIILFLRSWTLPVAMLCGVVMYFLYVNLAFLDGTHALANQLVSVIQPLLIFTMLLLTFCKISAHDLHLCRWHVCGLLLQLGLFALCVLALKSMPAENHWHVIIEGGMLCLICPTATAAAVVTGKLGGNPATLTTYTILINLCVAIFVPLAVPLLHPNDAHTFLHDFLLISSKVFPLLFFPFLLATFMRRFTPKIVKFLTSVKDLAFYLWAVALTLAIAVTTRSIVHTDCPALYLLGIALASLLASIVQFAFGHYIGRRFHDTISATQSLGQKNTVFAIWMGYTFLTPVSSIAGGFYSIWHNVFNSYQLYKIRANEPTSISK